MQGIRIYRLASFSSLHILSECYIPSLVPVAKLKAVDYDYNLMVFDLGDQ